MIYRQLVKFLSTESGDSVSLCARGDQLRRVFITRFSISLILILFFALPARAYDATADLAKSQQAESATPPNVNLALYFALRAANSGSAKAQREVGRLFMLRGEPKQATRWLIQAIGGGEYGALHWLKKNSPPGGPDAWFQRGLAYRQASNVQPDMRAALGWFLLAADAGHARAYYEAGVLYEKGRGVKADPGTAMYFYQCAADLDDPQGLFELARYKSNQHPTGNAADPDFEFAEYLFRKSARMMLELAEQGDNQAMIHVAYSYLQGDKGLDYDEEKAKHWFLKIAESGNSMGYRALGEICRDTPSCNRDEAIQWYEKAALKNDIVAARALEQLREKL